MKVLNSLVAIILVCSIFACEKDDLVTVKYGLFACCNFYEELGCNEASLAENIACALDGEGIPYFNGEVVVEGPHVVCITCCQCPSGEVLYLDVHESDLPALFDLGFEEN